VPSDISHYEAVYAGLRNHHLHVYSIVNEHRYYGWFFRWPYPPALFPWIYVVGRIHAAFGHPAFSALIKLPAIASDGVLAWIVYDVLRRTGRTTQAVIGSLLVSFGPCFALISGVAGQFDSFAMLPAVVALWVWWRWPRTPQVALLCGLLVGLGAALKIAPGLLIVPLLADATSTRQRRDLVIGTVAVPLVLFLPFLVADRSGILDIRHYSGIPGMGGLGLVLKPSLVRVWFAGADLPLHGLSAVLWHHGAAIAGLPTLVAAVFVLWKRPPLWQSAALVMLTFSVFNPSFWPQYICWVLPFMLLAGQLRRAFAVNLVGGAAGYLAYFLPPLSFSADLYLWLMYALLAVLCVSLVMTASDAASAGKPPETPDTAGRTVPGRGRRD
jgi:hypothetical protein